MANRRTVIGQLCRHDPAAARAEIKRVLVRHNGNLRACADDFGIERRQMLRLIHRYALWRLVWSLRRVGDRFRLPDELKRGLETR